jgi:hypothetical protein
MPKASKTSAPENVELDGYEGHLAELGGYTVAFEAYSADADMSPLFVGLPDDRCQCEHWGYVIKGKLTYKTDAGTEVFEAGDAYYVGSGHLPVLSAGTEVVEFSPTEELQQTMAVVEKNMAAAG